VDALRAARCGIVLAAGLLAPHLAYGADLPNVFSGAPRSTVPILCTDNYLAGRTHARGTGVIVDSRGTLLTAAHVVAEHQLYCDLTVLVPDNDWSRMRNFRAYSVRDCAQSVELDLAVCHILPIGRSTSALQAAMLRPNFPRVTISVTVTGFTGWGLSPTSRSGLLRGGNFFRKQEDCYCEVSMILTAFEGMSGAPVTTVDGQVIGIFTALGTGKFRGLAFGISIERALGFLQHHGVPLDDRGPTPREAR
jgi:S1-C subfamily serine protease